jgi:hypothetical protein
MMTSMPAMMPTRFPMIDMNNFQPLYATTFVGGMPISSGDPSSLSFDIMRRNNPSRSREVCVASLSVVVLLFLRNSYDSFSRGMCVACGADFLKTALCSTTISS